MICPVISWAAGEASQVTTGAICWGPTSGSEASTSAPRPCISGIVRRVAAPGEMVLTVQPYFASSRASTRLKPAMPAFAAPYPVELNGLQVFGLFWSVPADLAYLTLDEALEAKSLVVTEVDADGSVQELKVTNNGDSMVFLMAGEQLVGAKQNRVVNASMMVAAHSEIEELDVSCTEAGRWGYQSPTFRSAGSSSHSRLRRMMLKKSSDAYRREGRPRSDQHEVWDEISRKLNVMGSKSPSGALHQAYEDRQHQLDEMIAKITLPDDCSGAAFAFGGRIAGVELFDKPSTLTKQLPKLIRGYALDAIETVESEDDAAESNSDTTKGESGRREKPIDQGVVTEWLRTAAGLKSERYRSPGLGDDVRLEGEHLVGASLLVQDRPVHTELFSELN